MRSCSMCGTEKQVKTRSCPYGICPEEALCHSCYYTGTEDHSACLVQTEKIFYKDKEKQEAVKSGDFVFSSGINIGSGIVHALFVGSNMSIGRFIPLKLYLSLPKNKIITLSEIDVQPRVKIAPNDFFVELE